MRQPHGYIRAVDPTQARPTLEGDTIQCGHCNRIVRVKPGSGCTVYQLPTETPGVYREEPGCFCGRCMEPICLRCHQAGKCRPFELWLDQQEQAITRKLSLGRFYRYVTGGR